MVNKSPLIVSDAPWSLIGTKNVIVHSKAEEFKDGDLIKLSHGDRKTIAIITKIERSGKNSIEMDKFLRDSLSVAIGDRIEVERAPSVPDADTITISVLDTATQLRPELERDYSNILNGKILVAGTTELVLEEGLTFRIIETSPAEIVKISHKSIICQVEVDTPVNKILTTKTKNNKGKTNLRLLSEIPDVKFDDIGGLETVKKILTENIVYAIQKPDLFKKIGYEPIQGVLLYGPPGTGKTLIAKATAHESGANFIYRSASSFKDKYYGESERELRETFETAINLHPCVIFIDEIDAIAEARTESRVNIVNQLLTLMDQISGKNVYVIAATNRLEMIDEALIRPGRLFRIEIPYPDEVERERIFGIYLQGLEVPGEVIKNLALAAKKYSGAKIALACNMAKLIALRENEYAPDSKLKIEHLWTSMKILDKATDNDFAQFYTKDPNDLYDVS